MRKSLERKSLVSLVADAVPGSNYECDYPHSDTKGVELQKIRPVLKPKKDPSTQKMGRTPAPGSGVRTGPRGDTMYNKGSPSLHITI